MNLVRLGHYHVPNGQFDEGGYAEGSCQTALVVGVNSAKSVNLVVWDHDGDTLTREAVPVDDLTRIKGEEGAEDAASRATFHLSAECPWKR